VFSKLSNSFKICQVHVLYKDPGLNRLKRHLLGWHFCGRRIHSAAHEDNTSEDNSAYFLMTTLTLILTLIGSHDA